MFLLLLAEPEVDEVCTAKCFSMDWLHSCEFCLDLCGLQGMAHNDSADLTDRLFTLGHSSDLRT